LKWFRPDSGSGFFEAVGPDNNLRTFLGPLGTQTGRNAPPAKRFPFAMSSWIRSIIRPNKGEIIVAKDWGSQEVAIAAVLSGDLAMQQAYISGDPYCYLGQQAGAIPMDANKKWVKSPIAIIWNHLHLTPEGIENFKLTADLEASIKAESPQVWDQYLAYKGHSHQRGLFKACLSGDTWVLSKQRGYIQLQNVTKYDLLWNGFNYITHDGLEMKGVREVINIMGVRCTPDHLWRTEDGEWVKAGSINKSEGCEDRSIHINDLCRPQQPRASWRQVWGLVRSKLRGKIRR